MKHGTARNHQSVSAAAVRRARRQDQRPGLQRFDHQDAGWSRVRLGPGRTASWRDMPQSLDPPGRTEQLAASPALARRQTIEQETSRRPASRVLPAEERSRANRRSGSVCRSSVEKIAARLPVGISQRVADLHAQRNDGQTTRDQQVRSASLPQPGNSTDSVPLSHAAPYLGHASLSRQRQRYRLRPASPGPHQPQDNGNLSVGRSRSPRQQQSEVEIGFGWKFQMNKNPGKSLKMALSMESAIIALFTWK